MKVLGIFARHLGRVAAVVMACLAALAVALSAFAAVPVLLRHNVAVALVVGWVLSDYAATALMLARRFWRETREGERA